MPRMHLLETNDLSLHLEPDPCIAANGWLVFPTRVADAVASDDTERFL